MEFNHREQNKEKQLQKAPWQHRQRKFARTGLPCGHNAHTYLLQRTISGLQISSEGIRMDVTFSYSWGSQRSLQSCHSCQKQGGYKAGRVHIAKLKRNMEKHVLVHPPASPTRLWSSFDFSRPETQDHILVTQAGAAAQGTNLISLNLYFISVIVNHLCNKCKFHLGNNKQMFLSVNVGQDTAV